MIQLFIDMEKKFMFNLNKVHVEDFKSCGPLKHLSGTSCNQRTFRNERDVVTNGRGEKGLS